MNYVIVDESGYTGIDGLPLPRIYARNERDETVSWVWVMERTPAGWMEASALLQEKIARREVGK